MDLQTIAGYLGGLIILIGFPIYVRAIIKGKVSSNKVTWGVWTLVNALFVLSYYKTNGLVSSIWVPLVYLVTIGLVFLFLLKFSKESHWTWVEKVSLIAVVINLIFWFFYQSPLATLTFTLLIDIFGAVPLIVTIWKDSKADYLPGWYIALLGNSLNLLAIEKWDFANAAYPVYLALLSLVVSLLLQYPHFLRRS